jgi:hypothetical protein
MATTDEVLKRLRVLASIDVGNKVNTRMHYVYRNTWVATVMRTLVYTETREHTIGYVRTTIDNLSAITSRVVTQNWTLPDDVLAELDIVVASIHSALRQDRDTITERCLKAVRNPHVDVLGHPTGRLIGRREGSEIDMDAVLRACVETGTVVEINAHPSRLDLSGVHARRAVELGCKLAINSDAHAADGMEILPYGIATARRGWLRPEDVINTRPLDEMLALLKKG